MSRRELVIDIETSPHLCYSFQTQKAYIAPVQIIEPTRMIAFSAKWVGEKKVMWFSEHHHGPDVMIVAAHELLNEADVVITYNGDSFDLPHIEREIEQFNISNDDPLPEVSPFTSVDLYKVIRRNKRFASHKLGYILEQLCLGSKLEHYGFQLWLDCLAGDDRAWSIMRRYGKRDTTETEKLFVHELPRIKNLPAAGLFGVSVDGTLACPNCGSQSVQRRGWRYTRTRRYPRFSCNDCGKWSSESKSDGSVTLS